MPEETAGMPKPERWPRPIVHTPTPFEDDEVPVAYEPSFPRADDTSGAVAVTGAPPTPDPEALTRARAWLDKLLRDGETRQTRA
jgi:hypothetical protein